MHKVWLISRLVFVIALVAIPRVAGAQIVNVQGALAKTPAGDGETGQVEAKLNWRTGNNPIIDVGGAGSVIVRRGRLLGLALARGEYGFGRGLTLTEKTFEHLRARVFIDCRWRWELFVQHEFDRFRRLSLRTLAGTGPALQIVDQPGVAVTTGAAYLIEYERLDNRAGTIDAGEHYVDHRGSLYVTANETVNPTVTMVETVYVQPRLDRPSDVRVLGELALQAKMSTHVALKNSFTVAYDDTPPDQVGRYDTALEVAIAVTF
jgi:hypothetical protein